MGCPFARSGAAVMSETTEGRGTYEREQSDRRTEKPTEPLELLIGRGAGSGTAVIAVDQRVVARQLGREPRPFSQVCRRCRYGYPQVILTEPLHRHRGRWQVFPTVYWLTCPLLARAISRLEAEGHIRAYEERLRTEPDLAAEMERAHRDAAADRVARVSEEMRRLLERERPREARALAETGVAGIRSRDGVKCLHAHFADFVGRGGNPIGTDVYRQLVDRGVPPEGTDSCWRFCTVSGAPTSYGPGADEPHPTEIDRVGRPGLCDDER